MAPHIPVGVLTSEQKFFDEEAIELGQRLV